MGDGWRGVVLRPNARLHLRSGRVELCSPCGTTHRWPRLVPVADDPRNLPACLGLPPDVNEREDPAFVLPLLDMAKPMAAHLHRAVVLDRVHLETAGHEVSTNWRRLPEHLAKVLHRLRVVLDAFIVLIELEVIRKEGPEPRDI